MPAGRDDEGPVYLPIDSKFPQEDYASLADASDRATPSRPRTPARR
jgi:DNA recombination protein RmuC